MNTYHPSVDNFAIWITIIILLLCAYLMYDGLAHQSGVTKWVAISIAALTIVIPLFFYPFRESFDGKWKSGDGRSFTSYITHRNEDVYYLSDGTHIIAINAPKEWIDQMYQSTVQGEEGSSDH